MNIPSLLNHNEAKKLQKIWDNDYSTILNGKDDGVPFLKYVFELHLKLFGETCSSCPGKISGYIQKIKNLNPKKMVKDIKNTSNFKLNEGTIIPVRGTSTSYSNHNLTDEIAIELLAENPNRKVLFSKIPKNIDSLIAEFKSKNAEVKDLKIVTDLVTIGESKFTIEQAIALLEKINVKTKAFTAKGIETVIEKLPEESKSELAKLTTEVKDLTPIERSKDDIEFDLEKAQQDLEDLGPDAVAEDIALAKEEVEKFKTELDNLA